MPFTIVVLNKADGKPKRAVGVFDSQVLADRHRHRDMPTILATVLPIEEPLLPENFISMEEMKKAANFALTVLRDLKKAEKSGYVSKCVDELEEALKDKPYESKQYQFTVFDPRNSKRQVVQASNEHDAVIAAGYDREQAENWAHYFQVERAA